MSLDFRTVVDTVIEDFGETITVVSRSSGTYNDYGDLSFGTTTSTITAVIQPVSFEQEMFSHGQFNSGDVIFYIKSSDGLSLTTEDYIVYDSQNYKINDPVYYPASGNPQVYEVKTERV